MNGKLIVWEGERFKDMNNELTKANKDLWRENEEIRHCLGSSLEEKEKLITILDSSEKQHYDSPQLFTPVERECV